MHPLYRKADQLSQVAIGSAIEVHRLKVPGLIESIYKRCLMRELELRQVAAVNQRLVRIEYKGLQFDEPLRFARRGRRFCALRNWCDLLRSEHHDAAKTFVRVRRISCEPIFTAARAQ